LLLLYEIFFFLPSSYTCLSFLPLASPLFNLDGFRSIIFFTPFYQLSFSYTNLSSKCFVFQRRVGGSCDRSEFNGERWVTAFGLSWLTYGSDGEETKSRNLELSFKITS
jgi:hypothetical protein